MLLDIRARVLILLCIVKAGRAKRIQHVSPHGIVHHVRVE